jgi:predicted enzyme related to lactoylglutathione lyase
MAKGTITHIEFAADNPERARKFYAAIAGWRFGTMAAFADDWLFRSEEGHGCGLGVWAVRPWAGRPRLHHGRQAGRRGRPGRGDGGAVITPLSDVLGQGRFAAVMDPEGSEIGPWEVARAS